jgi:hypothetical protein
MNDVIKKGTINHKAFHPRIVVKFNDLVDIPYDGNAEINELLSQGHIMAWPQLKEFFPGITIRKLFTSVSAEKITELVARAKELDHSYRPPNFLNYFAIDCPFAIDPNQLMEVLRKSKIVELAYIQSGPSLPPTVNPVDDTLSVLQGYLNAGPQGIGARLAWGVTGGDGASSVKLIDIEQGWDLHHEDIAASTLPNTGAILDGYYKDHGTAVLGIIMMRDNALGGVGIVPNNNNAFVMSQWRDIGAPEPDWNTSDAIVAAVDYLSFGDILLLEAQTDDLWPFEVEEATFQSIRLATALGITVIEAAGNGSHNIDTRVTRESGAIIVGAATDTVPHTRRYNSNIGHRINCYAWGQRVETAWHSTSPPYTNSFEGTSSASAIIAGAALNVQSVMETTYNYRLSPEQMRNVLSDDLTGIPSANGRAMDKIGVMPNLERIIGGVLGVTPDVYIRDRVGDTGDLQTGVLCRSPDIIVLPSVVADPQGSYGSGSGREDDDDIAGDIQLGRDNFVYVRLSNRGAINSVNVTAQVYWSPSATLLTPSTWRFIGSTSVIPSVPSGLLTVSPPIRWAQADMPTVAGHYCFIALVGSALDPMPDVSGLDLNWDMANNWDRFFRFVGNNNNVAWRNYNIVAMPSGPPMPLPPPVPDDMPFREVAFLTRGAPNEVVKMKLRIGAQLPAKSRIFLQVPLGFLDLLEEHARFVAIDKKSRVAYIPIRHSGEHTVGEILYPSDSEFELKLLISIPEKYRKYDYEVYAVQIFKGKEMGRVTWRFTSKKERKKLSDR